MSAQNLDFALSFEMESNGEGGVACNPSLTNTRAKFIIIIMIMIMIIIIIIIIIIITTRVIVEGFIHSN